MPAPLSRRAFMSGVGGMSLLAAGMALSACSSSSSTTTSASGLAKVNFQLGWLANVENMGLFMADHAGYFRDEQLDVTLTPGGPSVVVEPLLVSGKALVGLDSVDTIAKARNEGAALKIVAATMQTNPTAIMSLASAPVRTLKDLVGKRLGVQQSGVEIVNTVFKANDIDPASVTIVPMQFDPAPLVAGDCDAFMSLLVNQPIQLDLEGVKTTTFTLAEYGYNVWADVLLVSERTLADKAKRELIVKIVRASVRGWQDALSDTDAAAKIVVEKYGKSLNLDLKAQQKTAAAFQSVIEAGDAKANGLLTMSAKGIADNIATLNSIGIKATADELFDTSVLSDVYAGKTRL
ncbi:ABC transporter substrate-binding protein [Streptosporangium lutulentum]|uniref:Thiamine pyrimidine synthase n=1 Tax=Streptosporangium lutulentum TaxID=1461250 RepID=A0ABT9QDP5_9ACTN|nr:ABC transporter substrate-binding protein [Streptosporangium lutulentum]MDP9844883.1 ABC-type nitrate/sulfonate/bicarbonate transport system substrate-binding protein [Streptosporangium lutulentum]